MRVGNRRALKRTGAAMLASLTGALGLVLTPGSAGALPGFEFERLQGGDRFATAAAIALETFPGGSDQVILAVGTNYPDALAGSFLAGALQAPILLANVDDVPDDTMDALATLAPTTVTLLGGTLALDNGVEAEVQAAGYDTDRISGENRFDTAKGIAINGAASGIGSTDAGETAVLSTGFNFPDALAVGPVAYAQSFPTLLTALDFLPPETEEALDELNIDHVLITGGTLAVDTGVEDDLDALGITHERLEGENRYATAVAIAEFALTLGHVDDHTNLASGDNFPDALVGGPHAGAESSTLVLNPESEVAPETCAFLEAHADTLVDGHALGGTEALDDESVAELEQCAGAEAPAPGGNQDFNVSPTEPQLADLGTDGIAFITYTFSNISPGTDVDISFLPCFAVTTDSDLNVAIADDPVPQNGYTPAQDNDAVLPGPPPSVEYLEESHNSFQNGVPNVAIFTVNGELQPGGETYVDDFTTPDDGILTVEFVATQSDCFVPIIFDDADGDDVLDLEPDTNLPIDPFAVGGAGIATNGEANQGQDIQGEVMFINKDADPSYFVLDGIPPAQGGNVFYYDGTDSFTYDGQDPPLILGEFSLSETEFETYLSPLDLIEDDGADDPAYSRNAPNTFEVDDDYAGTVTGVMASIGDADDNASDSGTNDVTVTWNTPDPVDGFITDYLVAGFAPGATGFPSVIAFDSDDDPAGSPVDPVQDDDGDQVDDDVDNEAIVEDLAGGDYVFIVFALTASDDQSLFGSEPSNVVTSAGAPGAPKSVVAAHLDIGIGNELGAISTGDVLTIDFDQTVTLVGIPEITVIDADGTTSVLIHGFNATFIQFDANTIVIDTLAPLVVDPGADGIQQYPSTVVGSSGIVDTDQGLQWNIIESPDNIF